MEPNRSEPNRYPWSVRFGGISYRSFSIGVISFQILYTGHKIQNVYLEYKVYVLLNRMNFLDLFKKWKWYEIFVWDSSEISMPSTLPGTKIYYSEYFLICYPNKLVCVDPTRLFGPLEYIRTFWSRIRKLALRL